MEMRLGRNPNDHKPAHGFTPVVLTVVTHLPELTGYHACRFEVVRTCLQSMRKGHEDLSVLVWDNGSCDAFRSWLTEEYKPDHLMLSSNIGKNAARSAIAGMLPHDKIMAYSDDDIYFYPGWLDASLDIFGAFPRVSVVTAYPLRVMFRWGCEKTIKKCKGLGTLEVGRLMPDAWDDDYAMSIGRDIAENRAMCAEDVDTRVTYNGRQAYCTAHHCQFIGLAGTVARVQMYEPLAMPDEKPFDKAMDAQGLRLATTERLARHMGNVIDDKLRSEIVCY